MMFLKELGQKFKQYWMLTLRYIINFIIRKDVDEMVVTYATLVMTNKMCQKTRVFGEIAQRAKRRGEQ